MRCGEDGLQNGGPRRSSTRGLSPLYSPLAFWILVIIVSAAFLVPRSLQGELCWMAAYHVCRPVVSTAECTTPRRGVRLSSRLGKLKTAL
jgi:hypothetical protein